MLLQQQQPLSLLGTKTGWLELTGCRVSLALLPVCSSAALSFPHQSQLHLAAACSWEVCAAVVVVCVVVVRSGRDVLVTALHCLLLGCSAEGCSWVVLVLVMVMVLLVLGYNWLVLVLVLLVLVLVLLVLVLVPLA